MRKPILSTCLAAGCMFISSMGCTPKPAPVVVSLATLRAADLPVDPAALAKRAAELYLTREAVSLENGLVVLERLIALQPGAYDPLWQAARMSFAIGDVADKDKGRREKFARLGVKYARAAIAIDPKRIEGQYYLALNLGYVAWSTNVGAFDILPEISSVGKIVASIDERYDYAGAQRLLGMLYLRSPGWPTSIGDPDEAQARLQRAVVLAPDYIPNHLFYAEALMANEKRGEALHEIDVALALPTPTDPELLQRLPQWRADADALKRKISNDGG